MLVGSIDSLVEVVHGVFRNGSDLSLRGEGVRSHLLPSEIDGLVTKDAFESLMLRRG